MEDSNLDSRRLAVLIDGDNAQPALLERVLAEVSKHGEVTIRRIYGDFSTPQMAGWTKDLLNKHAVLPVQHFGYTVRKNSTDMAMAIGAMDLLHDDRVDGFCIVSSDSDFTGLAMRIREEGLFVMGVGRSLTPKSLVNACKVFVYTENLVGRPSKEQPEPPPDWTEQLREALEIVAETQGDGWANLGAVGKAVRKLDPAFDPRTYGHKQLSALIKSRTDIFEMDEANTSVRLADPTK